MNVLCLVFYCVVQFHSVTSLQCYQCKATNEVSCLESQTPTNCEENQNGACMTISYGKTKGTNFGTHYRKNCWKSYSDCLSYCSRYNHLENCKVKCCTGNLCNRRVVQEVVKDNRKRSTERNSAAYIAPHSLTLLFAGIFFIVCNG